MADPHPPPPNPPAPSGAIQFRPRYCECDPMGVVHHAAYVPWMEIGRTELLRASGLSYAQLEARGVLLVITRLEVRYRRPARYDDLLELRTAVSGGGRVKIEHEYELFLTESATGEKPPEPVLLMTAATTLGCVDRQGRPGPLPEWLMVGRTQAR